MYLAFETSDVIILSVAAACIAAAVMLEVLRIIIPDIYEWVADHRKVRAEIIDAKRQVEKLTIKNREESGNRDRKNAERFRLKSQLSRAEMTMNQLERESCEVWHELGEPTVSDHLYVAKIANRLLADKTTKEADSAPAIWRFNNSVRIWATNERTARQRMYAAFPQNENFTYSELTEIQVSAPTPPTTARNTPQTFG